MSTGADIKKKDWVYRFKCNLKSEVKGTFFDLNSGGGQNPAIHCWDDGSCDWNKNTHWHIYSHPNANDPRVLIKSDARKGFVIGDGHGQRLRCEDWDQWDDRCHWYFEGGDVQNVAEYNSIRFRSYKHPNTYIDLEGGNKQNGTPFITWVGHGGANQAFHIIKR